ncbi:MAG: hypothetical protein WCR69_06830 [Sulfuricurvum sp.]
MENELFGMLEPIRDRAAKFLDADLDIRSKIGELRSEVFSDTSNIKNSSLIAITSNSSLFVAIGYDSQLFDIVAGHCLNGEEVSEDELVELRESISSEAINIIVGNALQTPPTGVAINISTPLYIDEIDSVFKDKLARVATTTIDTLFGSMYIAVVKPNTKTANIRS